MWSSARDRDLLLPGIGTVHDLKTAHHAGASIIAWPHLHGEAGVSRQHIGTWAWKLWALMMNHMTTPARWRSRPEA